MTPTISVVVPVYNSAPTLAELIQRLERSLSALGQFEIVLVNDGSRDNSWEVVRELAAHRPWLQAINLMRNYGQHNALLCGIRAVHGELVVTIDDDLQNPPEEIPKLLAKLNEGYDVVYGTPRQVQHGVWRALASQMTKLALQHAMGAETARQVSAFRAFRLPLREAFVHDQGPYVNVDVLLTWATTRFTAVRVRHDQRLAGDSTYTLQKLVTHAINMITGFSTIPLQLASLIGFACTLFGIGVLVYVIGRYLIEGSPVAGFPFLASTLAIFSGAQLFALGIIGEYLARMHFRMMARPSFVIREIVKTEEVLT